MEVTRGVLIYTPALGWAPEEDLNHLFVDKDVRSDWWTLYQPGKIANWPSDASIAVRGNRHACDDMLQGFLRYYSARVRDAFDRAGISGLQWLPVRIDGDGLGGTQYYYGHITSCIPALDVERSSLSYFPRKAPAHQRGKIATLMEACLFEEDIPRDLDIFRLEEHDTTILVSDKLRQVCFDQGFRFWSFIPVATSRRVVQ